MIVDEAIARQLFLIFIPVLSIICLFGSRHQPFPEISRRFGVFFLILSGLFWVGEQAPRPMEFSLLLSAAFVLSAGWFVIGILHMLRTRRDVFIAPMAGFILSVSYFGLLALMWPNLSTLEEWMGFFSLVMVFLGQTWLVFRGLLIGKLPLAWSQAGVVAMQKGQFLGPHGAIECFEKAWDVDEEHLNPMAYVALYALCEHTGQMEVAKDWKQSFELAGGHRSVSDDWIMMIHKTLLKFHGHGIPTYIHRLTNESE